MPGFLHVVFNWTEKHHPVFFSAVFSRNNVCKTLNFPSGMNYGSFVERKTKETLLACWPVNRQTVYSVSHRVLAVFKSKKISGNLGTNRLHRLLWHETQHVNRLSIKGNTTEQECNVLYLRALSTNILSIVLKYLVCLPGGWYIIILWNFQGSWYTVIVLSVFEVRSIQVAKSKSNSCPRKQSSRELSLICQVSLASKFGKGELVYLD